MNETVDERLGNGREKLETTFGDVGMTFPVAVTMIAFLHVTALHRCNQNVKCS